MQQPPRQRISAGSRAGRATWMPAAANLVAGRSSRRDPVSPQLLLQPEARQAEGLGGAGLVAVEAGERLADQGALEALDAGAQEQAVGAVVDGDAVLARGHLGREIGD